MLARVHQQRQFAKECVTRADLLAQSGRCYAAKFHSFFLLPSGIFLGLKGCINLENISKIREYYENGNIKTTEHGIRIHKCLERTDLNWNGGLHSVFEYILNNTAWATLSKKIYNRKNDIEEEMYEYTETVTQQNPGWIIFRYPNTEITWDCWGKHQR